MCVTDHQQSVEVGWLRKSEHKGQQEHDDHRDDDDDSSEPARAGARRDPFPAMWTLFRILIDPFIAVGAGYLVDIGALCRAVLGRGAFGIESIFIGLVGDARTSLRMVWLQTCSALLVDCFEE